MRGRRADRRADRQAGRQGRANLSKGYFEEWRARILIASLLTRPKLKPVVRRPRPPAYCLAIYRVHLM